MEMVIFAFGDIVKCKEQEGKIGLVCFGFKSCGIQNVLLDAIVLEKVFCWPPQNGRKACISEMYDFGFSVREIWTLSWKN